MDLVVVVAVVVETVEIAITVDLVETVVKEEATEVAIMSKYSLNLYLLLILNKN